MDNDDETLFGMQAVFPDAEALFSHALQPVENIKDDCFVVLDTNVLLLPYDTGKASLDQISEIYKVLIEKNRLVVPGQVAREFSKNRGKKISELFQQISRKRNNAASLKNDSYPLLESLKEYKKISSLEEDINEKLNEYRKFIGQLLEQISLWQWNDPVINLYRELFSKNVVLDIEPDKNNIQKDLIRRIEQKIPPGYKDAAKPDGGIGDLMIWYTILVIAEKHKKSTIFVSGDEKVDWQIRSESQALYPRYELIDEYRHKSDGASFHILSFSKFLNLFGVSKSVVAEIREKEMQQNEIEPLSTSDFTPIARNALYKWLILNYPEQTITDGRGGTARNYGADFEVLYDDGSRIGVGAIIIRSHISYSGLQKIILKSMHPSRTKEYKHFIVALIAQDELQANYILRQIDRDIVRAPEGIAILVAYLISNENFKIVYFS